jgi:hypothetical protein
VGALIRVARFFLAQCTKMGKYILGWCKTFEWPQNVPNVLGCKTDKMSIKYTKSSIERPSKIFPKWDFGFENIPSGNPGHETGFFSVHSFRNITVCQFPSSLTNQAEK